jgi:ankyrin repeat protein
MKKSFLLCGIIINLAATQCMPMAAIRSFLSRHTPTVLHAVKKAPTVLAHAARNHKVLTASLALASTVIAIPQARRAMSRGINSALNSCLFNAAQRGYARTVKILLKTGIDINQQDLGMTALHWAAAWGHQAVVESLLAHDADLNIVDNFGKTALHRAASNGHQVVVELLLARGADPNIVYNFGWTALHSAAHNGHQAVVESLLVHGANIDLTDNDGATALHRAASEGHQAVVESLLAHGADLNIVDNSGMTALHLAARSGWQAVVESLLAHGAGINQQVFLGRTALHYAAHNGHQAVVESLLAHGANPDIADDLGWTALYRAALRGHQAVVELLVSYGADIALRTIDGRTAEELASSEEIKSYLRSVPQLTANIQRAVERGDITAVRQLVAQGAPVITLGQDGNTLIHRVIRDYNPNEPTVHDEIARILMDVAPRQAACVRNRYGQTLLHSAAACGNTRIARYLLSHGAEVNAQDGRGNTALHRFRTGRMRDLLLEYHADPTIMNREGYVPMANYPDQWYDLIAAQAQQ